MVLFIFFALSTVPFNYSYCYRCLGPPIGAILFGLVAGMSASARQQYLPSVPVRFCLPQHSIGRCPRCR